MGLGIEKWIRAYADFIIRYRVWIIFMILVLVLAAVYGGKNLSFSNNYRAFFSSENPELNAFEDFQKTYSKNDNIMFVLQPRSGTVFTPRMAEAIEWLTAEAWQIPYTLRVDSVSNFQHTRGDNDELIVKPLIENGGTLTEGQLYLKSMIAREEPLLRGNLISPNLKTTGINVTIQYPEIDNLREVPEAVSYARKLAQQFRERYPEVTLVLSGLSMLNNAFAEAGQSDAATLVPIMYGLLVVMLVVTLRSFSASLITILVIGLSTATAMGLAGHFGIKLTPVSVTAPTIIMTLAIADSIHILVSMLGLMREDKLNKIDALKESIRINFVPVTITSITTIVGFLSLNFSDSPPFWHLGNITAMGIAAAWLFSLTFMPAVLSLLPIKSTRKKDMMHFMGQKLETFAEFVIAKRKQVLIVSVLVAGTLITIAPQVQLNDQFVHYFDHRIEFRNHAEFAIKHLNGIYVVEYSVPAADAGGISDTEYLQKMEQFTKWLREQPEVMHVYSYSDIIKRLNKNMHNDNEEWYRIPGNHNLAAQYLLLYELSLTYGLDLNDRINIDKSATRVSVSIGDITTVAMRNFLDRSEQWLKDNAPAYMQASPTGASVMFSYISQRNIESMLEGNLLAIVAIALILILTLRSVGLGLISIIPNAVPIVATFGVWSLLVGQVGMAAATVTATSLGIVVDDTVHFLTKYLLARREKHLSRPDAIRYAFRTVGTAIVMTTIILACGFGLLASSTFLINAQMGLLTAIAIGLALITDFLLLPALLLIGYKPEKETDNAVSQLKQAA